MKNRRDKHYYIFTGNINNRLLELIDTLNEEGQAEFEIWEPHDKSRNLKLLVLEGHPLAPQFCIDNRIWETGPNVYAAFYSEHMKEYDIHPGYFYCTN